MCLNDKQGIYLKLSIRKQVCRFDILTQLGMDTLSACFTGYEQANGIGGLVFAALHNYLCQNNN